MLISSCSSRERQRGGAGAASASCCAGVEKAAFEKRALQVRVEFSSSSKLARALRRLAPWVVTQARRAQLVGDDLDRGGEVERGNTPGFVRYGRQQLALVHLLAGQPERLVAEYDAAGWARAASTTRAAPPAPSPSARRFHAARAEQATTKADPAERFFEARADRACRRAHRPPDCQPFRLRIGKTPRRHEHEPREPHGLHRARGRADVAGMRVSDSTMRMLASGSAALTFAHAPGYFLYSITRTSRTVRADKCLSPESRCLQFLPIIRRC